jgi:hypothetical protein
MKDEINMLNFDFISFDGDYKAVLVLNTSRVCHSGLFRLSSQWKMMGHVWCYSPIDDEPWSALGDLFSPW